MCTQVCSYAEYAKAMASIQYLCFCLTSSWMYTSCFVCLAMLQFCCILVFQPGSCCPLLHD